jgi:hypothetical protein
MDERGIYHLILENIKEGGREYLDFTGRRRFLPIEYTTRYSVPLSEIDEFTTQYQNEQSMRKSLDHSDIDPLYKAYITYNYCGEKKLSCLYNDSMLQHIASKTIGVKRGCINMADTDTKIVLFNIYKEISDRKSKLTEEILGKTKNSYSINVHNKELIADIHVNQPHTERMLSYQFTQFVKAFTSYKEFRALYINYKEYKKKYDKEDINVYETEKSNVKCLSKKRKNAPVPGQISMFEILKNN